MKIFSVLLIAALMAVNGVDSPAGIGDNPLSDRTASYSLTALLDPATKKIDGTETLFWINRSRYPVSELRFHLYLNAFASRESTFMKESGGRHRSGFAGYKDGDWGWIELGEVIVSGDTIAEESRRFIQPDDGNPQDRTVLAMDLSNPVGPGDTTRIDIRFVSKLPRAFARTGFIGEFFLAGQWFPKIGVLETDEAGRPSWNCHQFHANSEFFSDFGVYELALTVPSEYVVGANGVSVKSRVNADGTTTHEFRQADVIDCVWTAYPHFVRFTHSVELASGAGVEVELLLHPVRKVHIDRYREAIDAMFWYFEEWLGPYPYSKLTIVDPGPDEAPAMGGMEYPAFITTGSDYGPMTPDGLKFFEMVLFHEFSHQYFQSILASNEFEEACSDEGFTSYFEHRTLNRYFGEMTGSSKGSSVDLLGFRYSSLAYHRLSYVGWPHLDSMDRFSWEFSTNAAYGVVNYSKPTLVLETLGNYLGPETWHKVMREYYDRWKFRHPSAGDFFDVVNEVTGEDFTWYFDQAVSGSKELDYEISSITNRRAAATDSSGADQYQSAVLVRRRGDFVFPVTVEVTFDDGSGETRSWDGKDGFHWFEFGIRPARIVEAVLDPENKVVLDTDLANNSRRFESNDLVVNKYSVSWLFWIQQLILSLMALI